ncbi:5-oxoprolinase [Novosphingobium endophyticum]|uniref:5-oxoprolinase n=1 Tax=Novosphingobium endophyticum TaxID=1955250 RepID=A0A916TQS9_9SPHN|nr:hydantoinase B/oxoprolinase family protein [Novosphingobium endophyticum]GGB92962.1 5-oxoprolinase [Novosphingobium endophyticum]
MANWQFWIDRGGTFTDIVALRPDGGFASTKLLSENPERYADAATAGIRQLMGLAPDAPLSSRAIDSIRMGTTVATNALLERRGVPVLLLVDHGFADLLAIGNQSRPRLFDLDIRLPRPLFDRVAEVGGRVDVDGRTIVPLDEAAVMEMLSRHREGGITACSIALIHGWMYPGAERRLAELARRAGFTQVSVSHEVSALAGLVARGSTTVIDAYLSPVLRDYVERIAEQVGDTRLYFMQSSGGLTERDRFRGKDAILSGPAGGVVGAARTAEAAGFDRIIGFDMGGTSTDVALYAGKLERVIDAEVAGVQVRAPMIAINTVAAGGGSILHFDGARLRVGPESAGANPGPACYRRGGPLTITDANLMLGKISADSFPAIFGPGGDEPLDREVVERGFGALTEEVAAATGLPMDPRELAEDFVRVAVASMARAIKEVSTSRGHDAADFTLQCFGGAGGQHACLVAEELGISTVMLHPFAGVLSAYGMGLADQRDVRRGGVERPLDLASHGEVAALAAALADEGRAVLARDMGAADVAVTKRALLRYEGTDTALEVSFGPIAAMTAEFEAAHRRRFGFATPGRGIFIESIEVETVLAGQRIASMPLPRRPGGGQAAPAGRAPLWSKGASHHAPVYDREALLAGDVIAGPARIREALATTVVEQGWEAQVDGTGNLILRQLGSAAGSRQIEIGGTPDPMLLELFNNIFMSVAEQMGAVLQRTSTSVNIKERLDFSCALFDGAGNLVANAPHVPVHLGAMGDSARTVIESRRASLKPGDMVVLNNPFRGGTHLPDVTVIAPVFAPDGREIRFFVANRGHHADIGGTAPGSMPANSTTLAEEGVVIDDFLLRDGGTFREAEFRALLASGRWPARSPDINVADIKAQIAANEAGIREIGAVVARYGWHVVRAYMRFIMANAEENVRRVIDRIRDGSFDYRMDDDALLRVTVSVDRRERTARIDFTGTSGQRPNNFNAPPAVTRAAVLYVFRCLVEDDIPLNEGCQLPIEIVVPEGSFLSPKPGAAVVAGNTEVSQAICNALLGALGAVASAQGTMNNLLFGNEDTQYYETIGGGAGAGADFDGASAVQTHMTNTRITDPEILELRYPVRLERFSIRRGSGGAGRRTGGDGTVRTIRALQGLTATIVSSRRIERPFGLAGGEAGQAGRQWVERADGTRMELAGTDQVDLAPGDAVTVETPGGGGFGEPGQTAAP